VRPHPLFRREGDDVHVRVQVPIDVAILGGQVNVPTPKRSTAQLRIPEGTQNGARLRLRGLGMPRLRGGGNGDLIAEVDLRLPLPVTSELRSLAEAVRNQREAAHVA
jgi:DnaJ-class molecular chaperone